MAPADPTGHGISAPDRFDPDSGQWVRELSGTGPQREAALARLHDLLLRIARSELQRRGSQLRITGPELDDLGYQAAADALLAIIVKLGQFRGESKFTTWAYKFVMLEVSAKIGRHFWATPAVPMDAEDWERLPDRLGLDPARETERRDLAGAVRRAVDEHLTLRQRQIFAALVLDGVPMDALVAELGSTRNTIYKTMFDARRKLRDALAANGYLNDQTSRPS
jgi:RNA polymerase sigma-70 factor (ECF subfamily)